MKFGSKVNLLDKVNALKAHTLLRYTNTHLPSAPHHAFNFPHFSKQKHKMTEPKYHPVQDTCDYKGSFEASTSESLLLNQHQCHGNYAQQKRSRALIWIFHGILLLCNFATAVILWGSHFNRYRTDIEDMEYGMLEMAFLQSWMQITDQNHEAPIKKIVRTEVRYRNLTFGHPTEYTAGSGPEVDELWDKITAPPGRGLRKSYKHSV